MYEGRRTAFQRREPRGVSERTRFEGFLVRMGHSEAPGGALGAFAWLPGVCNLNVRARSAVVYELRPFLCGSRSVEWGLRVSARLPMPRVGWGASVFSAYRIGVDQTAPEHKWTLILNPFSKGLLQRCLH